VAHLPPYVFDNAAGNQSDIKVMQELLRHASSRVTMDTYTQAVTAQKRKAQSGVIRLFRVRAMVPATEV
jgi:integrase